MALTHTDVRTVWPCLKKALADIKSSISAQWRPEDVYHALMSNKAVLLVSDEGGFVVLTEEQCPYTLRKELLIWVAWSREGDATERYMDEIEKLARKAGSDSITLWSPHKGMGRLTGFEEEMTLYRKRLNDKSEGC